MIIVFSDMNKCDFFIENTMMICPTKNNKLSVKEKSIIHVLCLVFIQFVIISISITVRLVWSSYIIQWFVI